MMRRILGISLLMVAALVCQRPAAAVTLDFETLADLEPVTSQFGGLTFAGTTALASGAVGGSLNEFEFPPLSGVTVVFDDGGPITITFGAPIGTVSGFFTYLVPVTITAFDTLLAPVGSATSAFGSNLALSGDPGSAPNELLQLAFAGGIASLTLQGDPAGGSFTLDDFTFVPVEKPAPTPVPGSLVLVVAAVVVGAGWYTRGWRNSKGDRFPTVR